MILPIVAYGDPVLKQRAKDVKENSGEIQSLVSDLFETMYNAQGVGLAAPQVGKSIRLFVVDASSFAEDAGDESLKEFKKVFINPEIIDEEGEEWKFNEGCLSIPGIREDVTRQPVVHLKYLDENFEPHEETFTGIAARVIQHEYDHLEGILFIDRLGAFKRRMLKGKLKDITKGEIEVPYRMRLPK